MKQKKTFTLIEMLIVIVIIGILAAALVPRLQAVQGRARDTKRKADLKQIHNGIELYKVDNIDYPRVHSSIPYNVAYNYRSSLATQPWIMYLTGFMTSIPIDPKNNAYPPRDPGNHTYAYGNVFNRAGGGPYFDLYAQLENTKDPERCGLIRYRTIKPLGGTDICGTAGLSTQLYIISAY